MLNSSERIGWKAELHKPVSREAAHEWRRELALPLVLSLVLVGLTCIPYVLGYALARPGTEYMGLLMNPEDSNSYLAKMQEGYAGSWVYTIPYTAQEHMPAFLGGFYIGLGHLARVLGLSIISMWHLARVVSSLLLFLATFGFVRSFLTDAQARGTAYLLAVTGSGLGWLLFLLGQNYWLGYFPVDFKMPESHLFFTALTFPHFAVGTTFILATIWLSHRALQTGRWGFALGAGAANLALAIVYPFLIYLSASILALWWLNLAFNRIRSSDCYSERSEESLAGARQRPFAPLRVTTTHDFSGRRLVVTIRRLPLRAGLQAAIALAVPAPMLLYYFWVLKLNPVFGAWDAQSVTLSPHPLHYVVAYGAMFILAAPTIHKRESRALWLWVLAVALLVYSPLNPQRRFLEGVQVPLAILAASGLHSYFLPRLCATSLFTRLASRPHYSIAGLERLLVVLLLLFFALSNLYVLGSTSLTAALQQPDLFFRQTAEVSAVDWAGANLPRGAVALAEYETGNFIPTRTGLRTVIGHWAETVHFEQTQAGVQKFFDLATAKQWRTHFLAEQRVDYVFYGPRERALGGYDPTQTPELTPIYTQAGVSIFRYAAARK